MARHNNKVARAIEVETINNEELATNDAIINNEELATEVEATQEVATTTIEEEATAPIAKIYTKESAMEEFKTTSSAIRGLTAFGMSRSEVANLLGKRYQHVRNVLITPIKKAK